jgi:two-component system cell cycle sensor histidine kinase/response regulator CckA
MPDSAYRKSNAQCMKYQHSTCGSLGRGETCDRQCVAIIGNGSAELVDGMAHDLANLICVIKMAADDIDTEEDLPEHCLESLNDILTMVDRATSITQQFLIISGRGIFQPHDLDMNESIAGRAMMLKRIVGERVTLDINSELQPLLVHADPAMLDQLLLNLIVNACDAMPNGGKLVIEAIGVEFDELSASQSAEARAGSFASLSVTDNGCGIPTELFPRIFEPFFTNKSSGGNPGLGLATAFAIVRQHQGWLSVESEVGHGTTVRVYIPRLISAARAVVVEHSWTS